jgi:hypothetical protein
MCSGHGTCLGLSGYCSCFSGYLGGTCSTCAPEYVLVSQGMSKSCVFLPGAVVTCGDGVRNGNEEGVDCGGSCATACNVSAAGTAESKPWWSKVRAPCPPISLRLRCGQRTRCCRRSYLVLRLRCLHWQVYRLRFKFAQEPVCQFGIKSLQVDGVSSVVFLGPSGCARCHRCQLCTLVELLYADSELSIRLKLQVCVSVLRLLPQLGNCRPHSSFRSYVADVLYW